MTDEPKDGRGRKPGKHQDSEFVNSARSSLFLSAYLKAIKSGKSDQAAKWIGIAAVNDRFDKEIPIAKSDPRYIKMSESEAKRILAKLRESAKGGVALLPELLDPSQWAQSGFPPYRIAEGRILTLGAVVAAKVGPLPKLTPAEPTPPPGARRKQKIHRDR